MLCHMENHAPNLDTAFHALADPTRRAILGRLVRGPTAVSAPAQPFAIGLPAFVKHLRVLERDGLITSEKSGRVRTCRMNAPQLVAAETWLARQRSLWQASADRLADYVETQMPTGPDDAQ